MVFLFFDSGNPLDCFDNPNCFFNEEGRGCRREPGDPGYVEWYPPGYSQPPPPAPPPEPKPARRRPLSTSTSTTPSASQPMSIQYYTRPTPDGSKVMTSIAYQGTKTKDELVADILARLIADDVTVTADVIEKVILHHDQAVIDFGMDSWKCEAVGHIGHSFTGGGSSSDLQGPWTYASMNLGLSCNLNDDGEARAEGAFVAENLGHKGRVVPVFAKVSDTWTKQTFHYTPGKSLLIELGNRGSVDFDLQKGHKVQLRKADGTLVDADDYALAEGSRIAARVPSSVGGDIQLILTIGLNGRTVVATYEHILST